MLYRSIYIGNPAHLKLKDKQLKITNPTTQIVKGSVPIEDLGLLMLDHYQITVSHQLLQELMKNNVVLISCDEKHLPLGAMLPFGGNTQYSERVKTQLEVSEPLKKQLWKQTVECKIQNQAKVLEHLGKYAAPMYDYLKEVKSGDVVINHKTTKFESNSQHPQHPLLSGSLLLSITKLRNLKAIHNNIQVTHFISYVVINHKTTKFESNSQHNPANIFYEFSCYQSQNYKI